MPCPRGTRGNLTAMTKATLRCIEESCGTSYPITDLRAECAKCGNLLDVRYEWAPLDPMALRETWKTRRTSMVKEDLSGVWRFREMFPFLVPRSDIITLREGNTPLLDAPRAAAYAGLER